MEQITICETQEEDEQEEPCQLKKLSSRPCSLLCAFENKCPVVFIDSHDFPVVRRLKPEDLDVKDH